MVYGPNFMVLLVLKVLAELRSELVTLSDPGATLDCAAAFWRYGPLGTVLHYFSPLAVGEGV